MTVGNPEHQPPLKLTQIIRAVGGGAHIGQLRRDLDVRLVTVGGIDRVFTQHVRAPDSP